MKQRTRRLLSIFLSVAMLLTMLPTSVLADDATVVTAESYEELVAYLQDPGLTQITIAGRYRNAYAGIYEPFAWPAGDDPVTLDLVGANSGCKLYVQGPWNIPENVTVNIDRRIGLMYEMNGSPSITVDGTWNITGRQGTVFNSAPYSRALTISESGRLTAEAPIPYTRSVTPVAENAVLKLNGTMDLNDNVGYVTKWELGSDAYVSDDSVLYMEDGASLACPGGGAVIGSQVYAGKDVNIPGTYTMSGKFYVEELMLDRGGELVIPAGSHITTAKLYSKQEDYSETLTLNGTLELADRTVDLVNNSRTTHLFTGNAAMNIGSGGALILRPGNHLSYADAVDANITGSGKIKLYALYDEESSSYTNLPSVFGYAGRTENGPAQVAESVEIWCSWEQNCSHTWGEGVDHENGTTHTCTNCGTEKLGGEDSGGSGGDSGSGEGGNSGTAEGYKLYYEYDEDLCSVTAYDWYDDACTPIPHGGILPINTEENRAYGVFEITDIADGYRIKSVCLNGEDRSSGFIDGAYGGCATTISEDSVLEVILEEIPEELSVITGVAVYQMNYGTLGTEPVTQINFTEDGLNRLQAVPVFDDAGAYPDYYASGLWQYSTDNGRTWNDLRSWGVRTDFWASWSGFRDFDFVNESYLLRIQIMPKEYYSTTADGGALFSEVIAVNSDPVPEIPSVPAVESVTFSVVGTANQGVYMNWTMETPEDGEPTADDIDSLEFWMQSESGTWKHFYTGFVGQDSVCLSKILSGTDLEGEFTKIRVYSVANGYDNAGNEVENGEYLAEISLTITREKGTGGSATYEKDNAGKEWIITMNGLTPGLETVLCVRRNSGISGGRMADIYVSNPSAATHRTMGGDLDQYTGEELAAAWYSLCQLKTSVTGASEADITITDLSGWKNFGSGETVCEHTGVSAYDYDSHSHWKYCSACHTQTEKADHTLVIDPYVPPTETTEGLTEGSHCSVCGYVKTSQNPIPVIQPQEVSWLFDAMQWDYGDRGTVFNEAYNDSEDGSELVYSGDNDRVALVDPETGTVTIQGAGTVTITATAPAVEGKYLETAASYVLTVNKAPLTVQANPVDIVYGEAPCGSGYTAAGFVFDEDESVLKGTAEYSFTYRQYDDVGDGTYAVRITGLTADNYDITFPDGELRVEKARQYTITLDNLEQVAGKVSPVTAVIAPQDATAEISVEYLVNGAWTESIPTGAGSYAVRAMLTGSDNILPNEACGAAAVLVVKPASQVGNTTVTAEKDENGSARIEVTEDELEEIVENIPEDGVLDIDVSAVEDARDIVLPADLIRSLDGSEKVDELNIRSDSASISMSGDVLGTMADAVTGKNDTVALEMTSVEEEDLTDEQKEALSSITNDAVIVEVSLVVTHYDETGKESGTTNIHKLGGNVEVTVAYPGSAADVNGKYVIVCYLSDDGSVTYTRAAYNAEDGTITFKTNHFSTFAVFVNTTPVVQVNDGIGDGIHAAGTTVTIRANSREGYRFIGWHVDAGNVELADAAAMDTSFVMPDGEVEISARYEMLPVEAVWNDAHTSLTIRNGAEGAASVVVAFYDELTGQMKMVRVLTAEEVLRGVEISGGTDLTDCVAKVMVLNRKYTPVAEAIEPEDSSAQG